MKIAVLSYTTGLYNRGVETATCELVSRWRKKHKVKLIEHKSSKGISLVRELLEFRPEVVMPLNRGWQAVWVRLFCWLFGSKMVVSGQAGYKDRWSLFTRPDLFIAITKRAARWSKQYGVGVKIAYVPNGVDLNKFKSTGKKIKLGLSKPVILCVASGDRYKRVEETILAVSTIKQGSLLLVGGSKQQEQLGKRLLGSRFQRRKFKHKEMPMVYRSADIFTLASEDSEAFGIVYLEALASGLPVVAPDDSLRREILGKYGTYIKDVTNKKDYGRKIRKALLQKKTRPNVWLSQFNWDKVAAEYLKLFNKLIV